jgi:cysteine rich repeat protein
MLIRQLTAASLLSLALLSLPGPTASAAEPSFVYCKEDIARLCPSVAPGGGKILGCLKQHENEVSVGCAKEVKAIKAKMGK